MPNNALKICYRAEFSGPGPKLNPGGFKLPGTIGVEIRKKGADWLAFRPGTQQQFTEITGQLDPTTAKNQVIVYFEKQETPWEMFELDPVNGSATKLKDGEITWDSKGRVYRKEIQKA